MMSENKLNGFVWSETLELLDNPDKIKEHNTEQEKSYIYEEIEHLKTQIAKAKSGRDRLLTLITMSEDDEGMDLEEIKEKMKELRSSELSYKKKLEGLQHEVNDNKNKKSTYALEEAIKYYLNLKGSNLDVDNKQKILGMIIKEVEVIDAETVYIHTF